MESAPRQVRFTYEFISSILRLDEATGFLYWKIPGRGRQMGKPAGTADSRGYITLTIKYKRVRAHNLVWLLHTGKWPEFELDHINHITGDNRPINLRDVTKSENNFNRQIYNKFGCPGIYEEAPGRYRAMYHTIRLGSFPTPQEAIDARKEYERSLGDSG